MLDSKLITALHGDARWAEAAIGAPRQRHLKRIADVVAATAGLILLSPLMLVVGAAIRLTSKGPVIFRQERVGLDGRAFEILKLRTMRQDAEVQGPQWAQRLDPRITRIGYFLRRSHLDELPQLVNVLLGDMSLVGPRPERPFFVEQFMRELPHYAQRLRVKPGITGLAQVYHKYDETIDDVRKKLLYDISYTHRLSFTLDVTILFATIRKLSGDQQAN